MQAIAAPTEHKAARIIPFLFYLIGGLLVFYFGANTFEVFSTNKNLVYEWGLTAGLLILAVVMQRLPYLQSYEGIASALFIVSAANAVNLSMGNFLGKMFAIGGSDMHALAIDKLSQSVPIVLTIILLTLWSRNDLGSIFLKRGNLRLGLTFGLISFVIFAIIFLVIVVLQSNAPRTEGLFATGVSVSTITRNIPWILLFCFTNSLMEELWFRGVSLRKLTPMLGWTGSIIVTALVFGICHSAATYITPIQMFIFSAIVISLGLVNAYIMLKTDSIWGSGFFHAGYDLLVILPIIASQ